MNEVENHAKNRTKRCPEKGFLALVDERLDDLTKEGKGCLRTHRVDMQEQVFNDRSRENVSIGPRYPRTIADLPRTFIREFITAGAMTRSKRAV